MQDEIKAATGFLSSRINTLPEIGMITGTGLGGLTEKIDVDFRIPYNEIPHFPVSTIKGHKGSLVSGRLAGRQVIAMEGRFHFYEGYTLREVTLPIRIMSSLGIKHLFISSAAGGLNPLFEPGDLMVVTDHINLTGNNPLIGPNLDEFGPRFTDMNHVYDSGLRNLAKQKALKKGIPLKHGVYVGITGPSLETPAETRFLRLIGADAVGMSTVPEVIVGAHCGLKILVIVVITNVNLPDCMKEISVDDVLEVASAASPPLSNLWEGIISDLS
jgi:purine-nucleoside phosphorylase